MDLARSKSGAPAYFLVLKFCKNALILNTVFKRILLKKSIAAIT